jgi:adenine-specific DNA glycosylase
VANRIGIADSDDPIVVERQLCEAMPPERWTRTSDTLILHGRRICRPKPLCEQCFVRDECDYYRLVVSRERERPASPKARPKIKPKTKLKAGARKAIAEMQPKRKADGAKRIRNARR